VCSGSRDLFTFCEIIDSISETVQDRDTATMKDKREITRGLSNDTNSNDLE